MRCNSLRSKHKQGIIYAADYTFAALGLLQQVHDGLFGFFESVFKSLVTDGLRTGAKIVNQSLQVVQLLPLLVHLEVQIITAIRYAIACPVRFNISV